MAEALRRKGSDATLWCTQDFPRRLGAGIRYHEGQQAVTVHSPELDLSDPSFFAVWHRRVQTAPDLELLHSGDRAFAVQQCDVFHRNLLDLLAPQAFWVNPPAASHLASQKLRQHHEASQCGLALPDTLFSNDPEEIRSFLREAGGRMVFKTLTPAAWRDDEDRDWAPFTVSITERDLVADDLLRQTPAIYQAEVEKAFEVRMTVMGREVFAAKILSQATTKGRLDWRLAYSELVMEKIEVPPEVAERSFALMERLGIVFGCFDFIVSPDGQWVFLEVNEMGQFLFIEHYTGMPLLDAFSDFLLSGQKDFRWADREPSIRFADVHEPVREAMLASARTHVQADSPRFYEGKKKARR